MILKDFKEDDHILIYTNDNNIMTDASNIGTRTIACTVLRISDMDVVIGWRRDEPRPIPNHMGNMCTVESHGNCYPGFVAWVRVSTKRLSPGYAISDGPCRQCSKQNSSQDKKCWWCQVSCPTDLKRTGP
jgi:hypothetical protein